MLDVGEGCALAREDFLLWREGMPRKIGDGGRKKAPGKGTGEGKNWLRGG